MVCDVILPDFEVSSVKGLVSIHIIFQIRSNSIQVPAASTAELSCVRTCFFSRYSVAYDFHRDDFVINRYGGAKEPIKWFHNCDVGVA